MGEVCSALRAANCAVPKPLPSSSSGSAPLTLRALRGSCLSHLEIEPSPIIRALVRETLGGVASLAQRSAQISHCRAHVPVRLRSRYRLSVRCLQQHCSSSPRPSGLEEHAPQSVLRSAAAPVGVARCVTDEPAPESLLASLALLLRNRFTRGARRRARILRRRRARRSGFAHHPPVTAFIFASCIV